MLSCLLQIPNIPGIDPATGKVIGAKTVKKAVKKVVKAASEAAAAGAAATTTDSWTAPPPIAEPIIEDATPSAIMEFLYSLDPVVTAIVIGFIILVAFWIYRRSFSATGQVGNTVLLLGPMESGKTVLYYQLKQGIFRATYTSMKENDETFVPKGFEGKIAPWRYVDLPGHASQRVKLEQLKSVSKSVVFVFDGSAPDQFGKVAQFLYTLLVDPVFQARKTPFFIAINKIDLLNDGASSSTAKVDESDSEGEGSNSAIDDIAERLEKILDKTRGLQSTMSDLDGTESRLRTLGRANEPFQFSHSVCPITVGGISALKGELEPVTDFLAAQ